VDSVESITIPDVHNTLVTKDQGTVWVVIQPKPGALCVGLSYPAKLWKVPAEIRFDAIHKLKRMGVL